MKYGIFSDIHSNLEALEVVLAYYRQENIAHFLCCGDIVGYGPNPNECIEIIQSLNNIVVVAGNHDLAVIGLKDLDWFNPIARQSIEWTTEMLDKKYWDYLKNLPYTYSQDDIFIVHGSPHDPINEYLLSVNAVRKNLELFDTLLCCVGHTHSPFYYQRDADSEEHFGILTERNIVLPGTMFKTLVNVGSVGQPRDGDPRAACAVYDTETKELVFKRFTYPVTQVQIKMKNAGLSQPLIDRLTYGY